MPAELQFSTFLREGRFMLPKGPDGCFFPPRAASPGTGAPFEWVEASGLAVVYSTTTVRPKPPAAPYNVCLVDLEEGCRMMSRVEGVVPEEVHIGMRVRARIESTDGGPVIVFEPMEGLS